MRQYKGYEIETFGSGYTVYYMGDEIFFDTLEESMRFIDDVTE